VQIGSEANTIGHDHGIGSTPVVSIAPDAGDGEDFGVRAGKPCARFAAGRSFRFRPASDRDQAAARFETVAPEKRVELIGSGVVDRFWLERLTSSLAFQHKGEAPRHLAEATIGNDRSGITRKHLVAEIRAVELANSVKPCGGLAYSLRHTVKIAHRKSLPRTKCDWQHVPFVFSYRMMIRPNDDELRRVIEIPLHTAKPYALRGVFTETRALDREVAVKTLSQRIMASLRRYEIMREPNAYEQGDRTLPLFDDVKEGRVGARKLGGR